MRRAADCCAFAASIRFAEKMVVPGIKNFGKVDEYLYRGAQPKPEGIEELKKLGIDTIVDLRGERHGLTERERAHAESLGMQRVSKNGEQGSVSPAN